MSVMSLPEGLTGRVNVSNSLSLPGYKPEINVSYVLNRGPRAGGGRREG